MVLRVGWPPNEVRPEEWLLWHEILSDACQPHEHLTADEWMPMAQNSTYKALQVCLLAKV